MKVIAILVVTLVANALGETASDLEKLSPEEYTARALAELKAMSKSRFLSDVQTPVFRIIKEENAAECYMKFKWMKIQRKIAIKAAIDFRRLQLRISFAFDDEVLFEHVIDLAKFCIPLPPPLNSIKICLHAYYVDIDLKPPRLSFDACFLITIASILHLKLNCISLDKKGKFSHHTRFQPEDEGIIVLSIEDGNLKFKLNNPIPKEVMEQIEKGWKDFEKGAKKTFDKVGKDLNKFGKDVEKGWNQAGLEINKFGKNVEKGFNKFGKDVEKGWNQAGQELNKFGKNVEKGFNKFGQDVKKEFDNIGQKFKNFFG